MEVLLDGKEISKSITAEGTLKDAILQMQQDMCPPDHLVIKIQCNGQEIVGEEMETSLSKPVSSYEKLEVTTSSRENLITDAMSQASLSLQETETNCQQVAAMLTEGNSAEGIEALGKCLQIWQQIHEAVGKSIIMLGIDPDNIMIQGESFETVISKPKDILMQIKQALKAQDYVLLADILQYEFKEVTDQWHLIIAKIRQEAEELELSTR